MFIVIWIVLSIILGIAGSYRKIGGAGAFFLSLLLSPLVGFIVVMVSAKKEDSRYILIWSDGTERPVEFSQIKKNVPYIYKTLGDSFEVYLKRSRRESDSEKLGAYNSYVQAKNSIITAYKLDG